MPIGKYTTGTAISCSVSFKDEIPPDELRSILSGEKPIGKWRSHISTLFNETPHDYLAGTIRELGLSAADAEKVYNALPPILQGKHFKDFIYHA